VEVMMPPMERSAVPLDADEYLFVGSSRIEWARQRLLIMVPTFSPALSSLILWVVKPNET
jgi:hypothetical protein